jgi:F0F1-type ATP synthase delta subunit
MKRDYTTAFVASIKGGTSVEVALRGLKTAMEKRNHVSLFVPVLRSAVTKLSHEQKYESAVVAVANVADASSAIVVESLKKLGVTEEPIVAVDDSLIGGAVISYNHRRIDASFKTALVQMYRAITK